MIDYRAELASDAARRSARALARSPRRQEEAEALRLSQSRIKHGINIRAQSALDALPGRWRRKLGAQYEQRAAGGLYVALLPALEWLENLTADYGLSRLPLNASDDDVIREAEACAKRAGSIMSTMHAMPVGLAYHRAATFAEEGGVEPPEAGPGALARLCCPLWWRRQLRKAHGRIVENQAIRLGFVHRKADIYASNETVRRRGQQVRRNQAMLENTIAENERGDQYTLAELAALGTSNKAIRRGELMTRIRGFEEIAVECSHVGEFVTVTCPSEMHPRLSETGEENAKFIGTNPREANQWLQGCWAKARAALARAGIAVYGFRVVEPHHDGTPHWHLLLFLDGGGLEGHAVERFRATLAHYFIGDGAAPDRQKRGLKFVGMSAKLGGAASYIAKYVAKNIDGYGVGKDLLGHDAITSSQRIEAWATTHGIRQFQQIGGPPVSVWRELRRVRVLPAEAPRCLQDAHAAVNKTQSGELIQRACWKRFVMALGGIFCPRRWQWVKLARQWVDRVGRYGEAIGEQPIGVEVEGKIFESMRHQWEVFSKRAQPARSPRTRVNNCTGEAPPKVPEMPPLHWNIGVAA